MNKLEKLEELSANNNIFIIDNYKFESEKIKGLYCDNVIALSNKLETSNEKSCVLAEELGHYFTTTGNIIDIRDEKNKKSEQRARLWAYDKQIGLQGIISAFKARCINQCEMAEHLGVTEKFLKDALLAYKNKYGLFTSVDNYVIGFEPTLYVIELFE